MDAQKIAVEDWTGSESKDGLNTKGDREGFVTEERFCDGVG